MLAPPTAPFDVPRWIDDAKVIPIITYGWQAGSTRELYLHMTLLHNLELLRQSEYIFSRGPLQDYEALRSRHAADQVLPARPWDKSLGSVK